MRCPTPSYLYVDMPIEVPQYGGGPNICGKVRMNQCTECNALVYSQTDHTRWHQEMYREIAHEAVTQARTELYAHENAKHPAPPPTPKTPQPVRRKRGTPLQRDYPDCVVCSRPVTDTLQDWTDGQGNHWHTTCRNEPADDPASEPLGSCTGCSRSFTARDTVKTRADGTRWHTGCEMMHTAQHAMDGMMQHALRQPVDTRLLVGTWPVEEPEDPKEPEVSEQCPSQIRNSPLDPPLPRRLVESLFTEEAIRLTRSRARR